MPSAQVENPTIHGVQLHVNDGLLAPDDVLEMRQSFPTEPLSDLYSRYLSDGYLLVKGLLPREDVLAAREAYFTHLESTDFLEPGTEPVEGIFNKSAERTDFPGIGAGSVKNSRPGETDNASHFVDRALQAHYEDWYCGSADGSVQGFCNHPRLKQFIADMTGWGDATHAVRRTLLRNNTPGNTAIGVHYDQSFMRHGEPTAATAWVPMGDVRVEGGGLIYLEDGDSLGEEIENEFTRKAQESGMSDEETRNAFNANMMSSGFLCAGPKEFGHRYKKRWVVGAYEAGDVVFHTPHMVTRSDSEFYRKMKTC